MTYDQWKTTNPRDYEPEEEQEPSELEQLHEELRETKLNAEYEANYAARRIKLLEAELEQALDYFKARYDVKDGDDGKQLPNEEMRLGQSIDEALHGIRF